MEGAVLQGSVELVRKALALTLLFDAGIEIADAAQQCTLQP